MKKLYLVIAVVIWMAFIGSSFYLYRKVTVENNQSTVLEMSRSFFKVILYTRYWNALHGGVYTIVNDANQPNKYLIDSLRDITTTNGLNLTKINPAYMSRQIFEISEKDSSMNFHITSLNPIRPLNKADQWEKISLNKFKTKNDEVFERISSDKGDYYRYMAPLMVEKSCLKCHAIQGYEVGQVRGGISISSHSKRFDLILAKQLDSIAVFHLIFLVIGLVGILGFYLFENKKYKEIYGLLQVVSESKKDIEIKAEQLEDLNQTKDKFFSIIAHDLINPIGNFKIIAEMLFKEYEIMDNKERMEYIQLSKSSAQNVYQLLQNLLIWSQSQKNSVNYNPQSLNLLNMVNSSLKVLESQLKNKEITIIYYIDDKIEIMGDKFMIDTLFRNLISNAIKFSFRLSKIIIEVKQLSSNFVEISIKDDGIGISKEDIDNLFRIDKKVSNRGTEDEPSTGLGLIICKEFVNHHNGKIWVESELGQGSAFKFTLPTIAN